MKKSMLDTSRLITRLRQFGGLRLLVQYARMGVLWTGIKACLRCLWEGRSLKQAYPVITRKIDDMLIAQYADAPQYSDDGPQTARRVGDNVIWFCWLQGMDRAPALVRACYNSIRRHLPDGEVVVITEENYREYVELPEHIERKYRQGIVPHPLLSDILRLMLLIRYGGTWMDATVLCTGDSHWKEIQETDLFLFRYFRGGREVGISNWFIHARPADDVLRSSLGMLLAYWRDYDCTVEYYIFHLFFSVAAKRYPDVMKRMPRGNSFAFLQLGNRLALDFDEAWWEELTGKVSFHKLNYRLAAKAGDAGSSYYQHIIKTYGA